MKIWIDADACPRPVRDVVFKASTKRRFPVTLVANSFVQTPSLKWITSVKVDSGLDVADDYLVEHASPGDLVITQDIPLAAELLEKGVDAMSPRGTMFTQANIGERLAIRDFMTEARASGITGGGPPPFDAKTKQKFSNAFDRWLTAALRGS